MSLARTEIYRDLRTRLEATPHGQRKDVLAETAAFLGVSVPTAYRELKSVGYGQDRKKRKDAGTTCIDKELAIMVSGLIRYGTRANGRRALRMNTAVDIVAKNGFGPLVDGKTGEVTMPHPTTVSRALALHGCHPDQLATAGQGGPHRQLRTRHPNHVWQMDASVCVIFYMPRGEVAVLDERSYNERKPGNLAKLNQERVIRWVVVDHYSGCFFVRYTLGSENAMTAIEMLTEAMCKRDDTDPMCGAPAILYTDPGPAFTAELMRGWLKKLGIRQETHMPGAARATGSVEVHQRIVEQGFEGRLRMYKAASLADLNAHLDAWRIAYNARQIHSRHNMTRYGMWLTIKENELVIPHSKDVLLSLAVESETPVKVKPNLTIALTPKGFTRQVYDLRSIPGIAIGEEVLATINPFEAPAADVTVCRPGEETHVYTVSSVVFDAAGFNVDAPVIGESYKGTADTAADTALKDIKRAAYNAPTVEAAEQAAKEKEAPFAHLNPFADVEAEKPRLFIPKRGRDLTLEATTKEEATLDHVAAAIDLRSRFAALGREWTATHMERLRNLYPDRVPAQEMAKLALRLIDAEAAEQRTTFRIIAGGAA